MAASAVLIFVKYALLMKYVHSMLDSHYSYQIWLVGWLFGWLISLSSMIIEHQ